MEILGVSIKGVIRPNFRVLFLPGVFVGLLAVISLLVISNTYTRISDQLERLETAGETENLLRGKVSTLQELGEIVVDQADDTVIALPDRNPAITMFTQLNLLAAKYSLTFSSREASAPGVYEGELFATPITFSLVGDLTQLISFIKDIKSLTPLSTIDDVRVSGGAGSGIVSMEVKMAVYFSGFPDKLPPLTQPIKTLTQKEKELMDTITSLQKPEFAEMSTTQPEPREDPFNWQ